MIDDLSVRYYVDSSWVYAFVDDFDWGLDGFASQVPVYDGNGNLTYDGSRVYTYDSWNRLAAVSLALPDDTLTPADADSDPDIGPVIAAFDYDGLGRRVSKVITNSGDWNDSYDYYYDGWKLIETRNTDSDICGQYLWGLGYIDELCLIRWQFDALAVRQTRDYYALQDANYNVLGVVDAEGDLVERYDYTPYGERRVYNHHHIVLSDYDDDGDVDLDDFITCNQNFGLTDATHDQGDSNGDGVVDLDDFILMRQEYGYVAQTGDALLYQSANESLTERGDIELCPFGHQGLFYDKETGLCDNRARYFNPAFGRFTSNDPKDQNTPGGGYHDGMNRFEYERSVPVTYVDPLGTWKRIYQEGHVWEAETGDTLWGLAARQEYGGQGKNWPCLWPTSDTKDRGYPNKIGSCDKYDASNLAVPSPGATDLKLSVSGDRVNFGGPVVNGNDVVSRIRATSSEGGTPISQFILEGHSGNGRMGGQYVQEGDVWVWKKAEPPFTVGLYAALDDSAPDFTRAQNRKGPKRCWFTRNAHAWFAGCKSSSIAKAFAGSALRVGATAHGTKTYSGIHPSKGIYWGEIEWENGQPKWKGSPNHNKDWKYPDAWNTYPGGL